MNYKGDKPGKTVYRKRGVKPAGAKKGGSGSAMKGRKANGPKAMQGRVGDRVIQPKPGKPTPYTGGGNPRVEPPVKPAGSPASRTMPRSPDLPPRARPVTPSTKYNASTKTAPRPPLPPKF